MFHQHWYNRPTWNRKDNQFLGVHCVVAKSLRPEVSHFLEHGAISCNKQFGDGQAADCVDHGSVPSRRFAELVCPEGFFARFKGVRVGPKGGYGGGTFELVASDNKARQKTSNNIKQDTADVSLRLGQNPLDFHAMLIFVDLRYFTLYRVPSYLGQRHRWSLPFPIHLLYCKAG